MTAFLQLGQTGEVTDAQYGFFHGLHAAGLSLQDIMRRYRFYSRSTLRRILASPIPPSVRKLERTKSGGGVSSEKKQAMRDRAKSVEKLALKTAVLKSDRGKSGRKQRTLRKVPVYPTDASIARALAVTESIKVSVSTARRDRLSRGLVCRVRPKGPARKEGDAATRVAFCRRARKRYVFSDESHFVLQDHSSRTQVVRRGQRTLHRQRDHYATKVSIWAMIGIGVKKLV